MAKGLQPVVKKTGKNKKKKEEHIFESIVDAIPHALFALEERKIVYANRASEYTFGWTAEELLGKSTELIYRDKKEFEEIGKHFYAKLEKEDINNEIYPCKNKSGKELICSVSASKIGNKLQKKRIVVMYENITERIEAEKEVQESEEQYRNFIENTHDIIMGFDLEGKFLHTNRSWHKTLGYGENELNSLNILDIVSDESLNEFRRFFDKAATNNPVAKKEVKFMSKTGKGVYMEGNLIPRVFCGGVVAIWGFFRDISENKKTQEEVYKKIEELEKFNKVAVDRELKMIELKKKIRELEAAVEYNFKSSDNV